MAAMQANPLLKTGVVIVAAGRGSRMHSDDGPKQYRMLGGKSVLQHALDVFLNKPQIACTIVAIHADDRPLYDESVRQHERLLDPVIGGDTRQASVHAGLEALAEQGISHVLIHDAARPFADSELIDRVLKGLETHAGSLPAIAVADTLKRGSGNLVDETAPRDGLYGAQTPQGFDFDTILTLHRKAVPETVDFTDDASIAEWGGVNVLLVEGSRRNTKITTEDDMREAQRMMSMTPDIRVGHGYDTHNWVKGGPVWLCGIEVAHTHSLRGHSDADVGLHALTDALLASMGEGDIGDHFPPSDPKWKDASSDIFLSHAAHLVRDHGGAITHADVTLVCEKPKIGPHRAAMRERIAEILSIDVSRVSVKATTNERSGFIGREEGMVAFATATVVMGHG